MDYPIKHRHEGKHFKKPKQHWQLRILLLFIGSYMPAAFGAENAAVSENDNSLPDLEFLEFLGQFETDEGQWIDPDSLLTDEFENLLDVTENSNPATDTGNTDASNISNGDTQQGS